MAESHWRRQLVWCQSVAAGNYRQVEWQGTIRLLSTWHCAMMNDLPIGELQQWDAIAGEPSFYTAHLTLRCPLMPYGYSNKASSCVRVKPSFVIFDIRAL